MCLAFSESTDNRQERCTLAPWRSILVVSVWSVRPLQAWPHPLETEEEPEPLE